MTRAGLPATTILGRHLERKSRDGALRPRGRVLPGLMRTGGWLLALAFSAFAVSRPRYGCSYKPRVVQARAWSELGR